MSLVRLHADQSGTATVEAAIALAALVSILVLCVAAVVATMADVRCIDAAREAARLVARGDPRALTLAHTLAPAGADIDVDTTGGVATARVSLRVWLPPVTVRARAVAAMEFGGVGDDLVRSDEPDQS